MCTDRLTEMPHGSADPPDFLPFFNDFLWVECGLAQTPAAILCSVEVPESSNLNIFSIMVSSGCVFFSA